MRYNKVRGIVRAKQGSQVPKLQRGNFVPGPGGMMDDGNTNYLDNIPMYNPELEGAYLKGSTTPSPKAALQQLKSANPNAFTWNLPTDIPYTPKNDISFTKKLGVLGKYAGEGIGNLAKNNPNLVGAGFDLLGNAFNKNITNNSGTDKIFGAGDTIANGLMAVNPVLGMYAKGAMALVKGINNIGGKKTQKFSANQQVLEQLGGSYGGSTADINLADSNANKKYGLFSSGSRKRADKQIDWARTQQNIMTDIADEASDMQAMSGNGLNYLNYKFNTNGGYDQRYMRAAKQGMKISDKIELVKKKRIIKNVINLDTKEIEWEPEVIIFKTGGIIETDYDVIYEIPKVEEFQKGGKTKEELETPEIEETTQKNLIPEGALHKNKHHIEHTEGLTQKGIPVIDNDGEQQAEIELDEIIFTLEVTKKLEELYKDGSDEAAIEAGKLLVKEILFNTDDRTGLISKCEKGGKICQIGE